MNTLVITAMTLMIMYVLIVRMVFGEFPPSLSMTHYWWKKKGMYWPFRALMYATPILLCPAWFEAADSINPNWTFLAFLSGIALAGVGFFANFLSNQKYGHYICTAIAAILSLIWVNIAGYWWVAWIMYGSAIAFVIYSYNKQSKFDKEHLSVIDRIKDTNVMFWLEMAAFFTIYITLIIVLCLG